MLLCNIHDLWMCFCSISTINDRSLQATSSAVYGPNSLCPRLVHTLKRAQPNNSYRMTGRITYVMECISLRNKSGILLKCKTFRQAKSRHLFLLKHPAAEKGYKRSGDTQRIRSCLPRSHLSTACLWIAFECGDRYKGIDPWLGGLCMTVVQCQSRSCARQVCQSTT